MADDEPLASPELGGFDVVYPIQGSEAGFGKDVAEHLRHKGYCMVQMSESQRTRSEAIQAIDLVGESMQDSFRQETESSYLGMHNATNVKALPSDQSEDVAESALAKLKQQMVSTFDALKVYTEDYFGHTCWASTSIWARVTDGGAEVDDAMPMNESDIDGNYIQAYERFVQGRTICVMYFVDSEWGDMALYPRIGSELAACGMEPVKLPISSNKMLIFRHDQLGYSYQPKGLSLALQSWMLSDIPIAQRNMITANVTGVKEAPTGDNAQVMMIETRIGGNALGAERFWALFSAGTDAQVHWPENRWETELYYSVDDIMKSYTYHGSFMGWSDMISFDNAFFKIDEKESALMSPGQHHVLETGYGCLYKAGHTRDTLQGENIGVFIGDVGMDWHTAAPEWSLQFSQCKTAADLNMGIHNGVTCSRLSHILDMKGPTQTVDTACSSSLVALQAGHKQMMSFATDENKDDKCISAPHSILAGGLNIMIHPMGYVTGAMGNMLTHNGRCFTFDRSADGYERGEGTGFMYVKWSGDRMDVEERFACLVGTASGHDGRSASLTAPNGPAQQDIIRRSMRLAGLDPSLISVCECHGTGTALGDPIEIGSLQGVMKGMREFPLLNTSAKTNIGHLEGGAGIAGIMKCVMMVMFSCGPPNNHLRVVNPNLITAGYPVFFQQEMADTTFSSSFIGVSSFGFGGTNSRADVYGRCVQGSKNTGNIWTPKRFEDRALSYAHGLRGMYKGYDKLDNKVVPHIPISIIGSWDDWAKEYEMTCVEEGCFTYRLTVGDSRKERFQLCVGHDREQRLYPAVELGDASCMIVGPALNPAINSSYLGKSWLVDAARDAMPAGTAYRITFKWQGEKSISWEPEPIPGIADKPLKQHRYFICGSWNHFEPAEMHPVAMVDEDCSVHETEIVCNTDGSARFQFLRDGDIAKMIYPSAWQSARGPDGSGRGRFFEVNGLDSEKMKLQLSFRNASISIKAISEKGEQRTWTSDHQKQYYVSGSFNGWKYTRLSEDAEVRGLYSYRVEVLSEEPIEYEILVDADGSTKLQGLSTIMLESDPAVMDATRTFKGRSGSTWQIVVDLNQDDPNRIVYHRLATYTEIHKLEK